MKWKEIFPYDPRPVQPDFMNDMVASLGEKNACVLIATNGFGKTLCSLSASKELDFNRVYYATRTHKQAENVIKTIHDINNHAGKVIMTAMELSGRERSCVAREIAPSFGLDARSLCARYRSDAVCKTGRNEDEWLHVTLPGRRVTVDLPPVMNSNDLKRIALKNATCPYYLSTSIQSKYNVVACSYNHVFDKVVRDSLGLKINNALIICDEAHNIIGAIESSLTRELSTKTLMEAKRAATIISPSTTNVFNKLESLLVKIEYYFKRQSNSRKMVKVDDINAFLDEVGMKKKWFGWATRCLKNDDQGSGTLGEILAFIATLMNEGKKDVYYYTKKGGKDKERFLRVTSLDVKPVIKEMLESGVKIAFMSGTISPSWFMSRLGLKQFPVHEYSLPKRNLEIYISDYVNGKNTRLSSYFNERENEDNLIGFAEHVAEILPEIPGGSIAFFPSYDFRDKIIGSWGAAGYIDYDDDITRCFMGNGKAVPVYVEKKEDKSKKIIKEYKMQTKNGGNALLLAVFRGGASEGEDFPGNECRGVFCIGFPVMNTMSSDVQFKMDYYDRVNNGSGAFWVKWDAMLSVSQAIGRGIRDPVNDKAVAILLGTRYTKKSNVDYLSRWIRESIVTRSQWLKPSEIASGVRKFFSK